MGKEKDWDIDPPGVRSVLIKTGGVVRQIEGEGKALSKLVESAAASAGTILGNDVDRTPKGNERPVAGDAYACELGVVAGALAEYFEKRGKCLSYMAARACKSLDGATDATTAYINGDLQMAADSQREARGLPQGFEFLPVDQRGVPKSWT
ncbi:DUF6507 family protein [Streptomyces sp. P1-3]|uniref:DUF6507 family protein n=1 Tax=Streptomyces sp. P1-3 TaxID=3421658 RepID=UPI003D36B86B